MLQVPRKYEVMLCGKPPFWGNYNEQLRRMKRETFPMSDSTWQQISRPAKELIRGLLRADPKQRTGRNGEWMKLEDVLRNPWLRLQESHGGMDTRIASAHEFAAARCSGEMCQTCHDVFSRTSQFFSICVASVARQLDHRSLRDVHKVFSEMDTNGDGVLELHEVREGFQKFFGDLAFIFSEACLLACLLVCLLAGLLLLLFPGLLLRAIEETLALDIRSPLQKQRHPNPGDPGDNRPFFTGDLWFHQLHLKYSLLPLARPGEAAAAVRRPARHLLNGMGTKDKAKAPPGLLATLGLSHHGKLIASFAPSKMAPKAKSVKCTNCKVDADVYCVDCNRELCIFCTTLLHHPTTKERLAAVAAAGEKHSLEDIVKEDARPEVKIISPILLELILVSGAVFFFSGTGISPEYFSGESYCPGVGRVRYWIARFDANVFFFLKNEFAQYCDCEDSYWRFFMDTWIRSVLTNTDSNGRGAAAKDWGTKRLLAPGKGSG
eukprot:s1797_g15.t1